MAALPPDPISGRIAEFGRKLRRGEITALAATEAYLARIKILEPTLGAYEYLAADRARAAARAVDALLAAGTDLGPLMGVPIALKDLIVVDGMPTTAGTKLDISDLLEPQGTLANWLLRAGCVVLGKSKTVEFARAGTGINAVRGTPRNPWDTKVFRVAGGSSNGSGVATAGGLCGFSIGSDTGGSIRLPASFCGNFGVKTTKGAWPTDGVFPLSTTLDTLGPMTNSAHDAAVIWSALMGGPVPEAAAPRGLRLGRPTNHFFDNLEPDVATCMEKAIAALEKAGVTIVPSAIPEVVEQSGYYPGLLTPELLATLGRDRFMKGRDVIDPFVWRRAAAGLDAPADAYIQKRRRQVELVKIGHARLDAEGLDGWITPTSPIVAPPLTAFAEGATGDALHTRLSSTTHMGNLYGMCGTSTPIQALGSALPVGLQLMCRGGEDARTLSIGRLFEELFGPPPVADLRAFS